MRKGFTLIEVVIAMMVLIILLTAILNSGMLAFNTKLLSSVKDTEYNLSVSACEKFKSENMPLENKNVVLYLNGLNDFNQNISEVIAYQNNISNTDIQFIRDNNFEGKDYALILCITKREYACSLRATAIYVKGLKGQTSGTSLRIMR